MNERDLFLCHSSADKAWVKDLGGRIESEIWNHRPLTVFLDEWDIQPGENIILRLNDALEKSRFVAVVMSPEMMTSEWCKAEVASVLAEDPTNRRGRLIPLRLRDKHKTTGKRLIIPPFVRSLNYLDFRKKKDFTSSYSRLIAKLRGEAPPRGSRRQRTATHDTSQLTPAIPEGSDEPDPIEETLISNLLPVRMLPSTVWSALTSLRKHRDLPQGKHFPPFLLKEGGLFSFHDLSDVHGPLASLLNDHNVQRHTIIEWREERNRWRWTIELLNRTLRDHLSREYIRYDMKRERFFFAGEKGVSRRLRWGTGEERTVARAPDSDKGGYWVHQAARLRFEALGKRVYLGVEPCWVFTVDGRIPVPKEHSGTLSMRWGGKERNGTILRHVLMWSDALAHGRREASIRCGTQRLVIGRLPVTTRALAGIATDKVKVRALLKFTKSELDLSAVDDDVFKHLEVNGNGNNEE